MLLICSTLLWSLAVHAQSFEQLTFLRINEVPMSVRGQAMGFVSDDDFAANPAILGGVKTASFALAGSRVSYDLLDTMMIQPNFFHSRFVNFERSDLSQVSLVIPVRSFVVGVWHRNEPQLSGVQALPAGGFGPWEESVCTPDPCIPPFFGVMSPSFEREDKRYGASIAFERGAFSFGASAEIQQLDERVGLLRSRYSIEPALLDRIEHRTSGTEIVPTVGVRWKANPKVTLAAAYTGSGTYRATTNACYAVGEGCGSEFARIGEGEMKTPDALRASVSFKPVDHAVLVAEVVRRGYGNLAHTDDSPFAANLLNIQYQDAFELHAGAEYKVSRVSLRAGWWRDPAHTRTPYPDYNLGSDHEHVTFGAGFDFGGGRLDVAFDDPDDDALRRASIGVTFAVPSL